MSLLKLNFYMKNILAKIPDRTGITKTSANLKNINLEPTMANSKGIAPIPNIAQLVIKATAVPKPAPALTTDAIIGKAT